LNIFVGNLSFNMTERELESAFADYGEVQSARIATDRDTNRSRGFGFVEMANETEAKAAIAALNGKDFLGRTLTVNEARPREDRPNRGGGGYGGGGGGYGGGGGGGNRYGNSRARY
jgi:RNA recognition motif-containing protein